AASRRGLPGGHAPPAGTPPRSRRGHHPPPLPWTSFLARSLATPRLRRALTALRLRRGRLLRRLSTALPSALLRGRCRACGEQLDRLLDRHLFRIRVLRQRSVHVAVLHVRTVSPRVQQNRLAVLRVRADLAEYLRRPAPLLRLREQLQRALQPDRIHVVIRSERSEVLLVHHERTETPDSGLDRFAGLRVRSEGARQRQQ